MKQACSMSFSSMAIQDIKWNEHLSFMHLGCRKGYVGTTFSGSCSGVELFTSDTSHTFGSREDCSIVLVRFY